MANIGFAQTNRLFTHCLTQLESCPSTTSSQLTDTQNALLSYLRFDKIVEEYGLAVLIAGGFGDELLCGNMAGQLAQWQIPVLPLLIEQARKLYLEHRHDILAQSHQPPEILRGTFRQFADLDAQYFMQCEDIFPKIYSYVRNHFTDFEALLTYQAA